MPSPFARAMAAADTVVARTFGEAVLVTPMTGAGELAARTPDPLRGSTLVRGVFSLKPGEETLQGVRRGTELNGMTRVAGAPAALWFPASVLAGLPHALRPGDRITLTERPGEPVYELVKRGPSDLDDQTWPLVRVAP
ncbi:hypothetical protein [Methylobacterium sp. WSM2598]|uniref:hypothetical protein n=1 Tax=Methylobacterium sp. WSM2598 TaxID=398261 RepID=UPI000362725B|nr:hypothetical protein [Methylobacterium sp. WSM2598]